MEDKELRKDMLSLARDLILIMRNKNCFVKRDTLEFKANRFDYLEKKVNQFEIIHDYPMEGDL